MSKFYACLFSLTLATQAQAAEWKGEGDLGFSQVSGNSESKSLNAAVSAGYDTGAKWKHLLSLNAFNASQDDDRSAESYGLSFSSDYAINETTYASGNLRYVTDKFSGYESQTALAATLGRHFIDDGITLLDGEIGAGYRLSELITGEDENEAVATAKAVFNRKLTDSTNFESNLLLESGSSNTYIEGGVALKVSMTETLALKLAYIAKHNTDVPVDTDKTDRFTTVSLNYTF